LQPQLEKSNFKDNNFKLNTNIFPPQKHNGCSHPVEKAILRITALNQSSNIDIFLLSKAQSFL